MERMTILTCKVFATSTTILKGRKKRMKSMENEYEEENWDKLRKEGDLLFNIYVDGKYVGGVYQGTWCEATEDNVERWREQLQDAVDIEDYETAAQLRDKINKTK